MRTVHLAGREVGRLGLGLAAAGRPGYLVIDHDLGDDRSVPTLRARAHDLLDGEQHAVGWATVHCMAPFGQFPVAQRA